MFRETMLFNNKTNQYRIEEKNRRPLLCRLDYPFAISSAWKPDLTHDGEHTASYNYIYQSLY
jgi:DELLA protein